MYQPVACMNWHYVIWIHLDDRSISRSDICPAEQQLHGWAMLTLGGNMTNPSFPVNYIWLFYSIKVLKGGRLFIDGSGCRPETTESPLSAATVCRIHRSTPWVFERTHLWKHTRSDKCKPDLVLFRPSEWPLVTESTVFLASCSKWGYTRIGFIQDT